jgi:O-antigen/teichoic acid export membrane protein
MTKSFKSETLELSPKADLGVMHGRDPWQLARGWRRYLDPCRSLCSGKIGRAAIALFVRQVVVMALGVGSSVAVARWLGPDTVGRFAMLIFVTQGILGYFGDLGLKAALIRKRGDLHPIELATAQKIVFLASLILTAAIGALLPLSFRLLNLGPENYLPATIFLGLLIVRNQRMVPLAILERGMRFKIVSAVEACESLIYTLLIVILAFHRLGIWCYVVAMGCRDIFGTLAFNVIAHPPFRSFSWTSIRPHVGFSLMYQGGSLFNMLTLAFPPIVIGRLLGKSAMGYAAWASALSLYPLVICNAMARVYLPAFSDAASDPVLLRSRVERSLQINACIAWPLCVGLSTLSTPIIATVFTLKWLPAQPLLYAYCVNAMMTAVGLPLTELFFAQNDAWFNLKLCGFWTLPTWTLGTWVVYRYGLNGFAMFQGVLQSGWLLAFLRARAVDGLRVFSPLRAPLLLVTFLAAINLMLLRWTRLLSIYPLAAVVAMEGGLCAAYLYRVLCSWRGESTSAAMEPTLSEAT